MTRPGFMIYHDNIKRIGVLSLEQKGALLDALCAYSTSGELTISEDDLVLWLIFDVMRDAIDRDTEKYDRKSAAGKNNVGKRWNPDTKSYQLIPTDTNGYQAIPTDTNGYQAIPTDTNGYQAIPTDTNEYQTIPKNTTVSTVSVTEPVTISESLTEPITQTKTVTGAGTQPDGLTAYVTNNLHRLTPGNWESLREIAAEGMSEDMIRLAVDTANAQGVRTFAYVQSILDRWIVDGMHTPEDVREAERKRRTKNDPPKKQPPRRAEGFEYK